jgi:hypothetical protein
VAGNYEPFRALKWNMFLVEEVNYEALTTKIQALPGL